MVYAESAIPCSGEHCSERVGIREGGFQNSAKKKMSSVSDTGFGFLSAAQVIRSAVIHNDIHDPIEVLRKDCIS